MGNINLDSELTPSAKLRDRKQQFAVAIAILAAAVAGLFLCAYFFRTKPDLITLQTDHSGWHCLSLTADETLLLVARWDGAVEFYSFPDGVLLRTLKAHDGSGGTLAVAADGRTLCTTDSYSLKLWDLPECRLRVDFVLKDKRVERIAAHPKRPYFALSGFRNDSGPECCLWTWNITNKSELALLCELTAMDMPSFSGDGRLLAVEQNIEGPRSRKIGYLVVWDLDRRREDWRVETTGVDVAMVHFIGNTQKLAVASRTRSPEQKPTIEIWDYEQRVYVGQLPTDAHEYSITTLASSADGRILASGDWRGNIIIWDMETMREVQRMQANVNYRPAILAMLMTRDGKWLVTASRGSARDSERGKDEVKIWRIKP